MVEAGLMPRRPQPVSRGTDRSTSTFTKIANLFLKLNICLSKNDLVTPLLAAGREEGYRSTA
jgi:hypothetical protein